MRYVSSIAPLPPRPTDEYVPTQRPVAIASIQPRNLVYYIISFDGSWLVIFHMGL